MKFSYNWLADLAGGLERTSPRDLARLITMKTAESEGVEEFAPWLAQIKVARVVSAEPIPGSKNQKAVIELGDGVQQTVVCGAPNCRAGVNTAYVPPGTRLGAREITKATISGVESAGMLASGAELSINRESAGILELDLEPGMSLGLEPDHIIEIDNKSLTHRPDLWGHFGMAREVAAIAQGHLQDPVDISLLPAGEGAVRVEIADYTLCPRYSALVFENVTVKPSPLWLQYRLEAIGLNPINNIVDVTNLVMAELAQPMHAFDANRLAGDTIFVRPARAGESCKALNGESYELTTANLVIADANGPVAIAGVIGGMDSAIDANTNKIVFESANFQASSVRKTSAALKLRTDASMRFEKSQDPVNTTRALARAIALLREVSPGIRLAGGLVDNATAMRQPEPITLSVEWLTRKLGKPVTTAEVRQILESLDFGVAETAPGVFAVTVPSWRATKDVAIKDDLVEEVGRMIGYDNITPAPPELAVSVPFSDPQRAYVQRLRTIAVAQGFTEVYNYSFVSDQAAAELQLEPEKHVRLLNPIAEGQNLMRTSLVPGLLKNTRDNARFYDQFRLFEIGHEIRRDGERIDERAAFGALIFAKEDSDQLTELKHLAESLVPGVLAGAAQPRSFEHPMRVASLVCGDVEVGRLFEVHPSLLDAGRATILELDIESAMRSGERAIRFEPIRRFPSSAFDLSVVTDGREPVLAVEQRLRQFAPEADRVEFVRQYSGPPLPEGKKSVSYRVTISAPDRTLSSEEVGKVRAEIIRSMREAGYDLRV